MYYFLLTLLHTGVRVARKTYVIDMAEAVGAPWTPGRIPVWPPAEKPR